MRESRYSGLFSFWLSCFFWGYSSLVGVAGEVLGERNLRVSSVDLFLRVPSDWTLWEEGEFGWEEKDFSKASGDLELGGFFELFKYPLEARGVNPSVFVSWKKGEGASPSARLEEVRGHLQREVIPCELQGGIFYEQVTFEVPPKFLSSDVLYFEFRGRLSPRIAGVLGQREEWVRVYWKSGKLYDVMVKFSCDGEEKDPFSEERFFEFILDGVELEGKRAFSF